MSTVNLILSSFFNKHATHTISVSLETSTLLDLRYQLFSLTDIAPEFLVLHHNGVKINPNDDEDGSRTLASVNISSSSTLQYSDKTTVAQSSGEQPQAQTDVAKRQTIDKDLIDSIAKSFQACQIPATSSESRTTFTSLQPFSSASITDEKTRKFLARVRNYQQGTLIKESKSLQERALKDIPLSELRLKAEERRKNGDKYKTTDLSLAKELLHWFKNDYFKWMDAPKCWSCDKETKYVRTEPPLESEKKYDASRTEVFICDCGAMTRFPRYNDTGKLLDTRRGRCGEWANAFFLMAKACGLTVRAVYDWTDHVWTEIYCNEEKRWVHSDSCEDCLDEPLLYESGWTKKLTYCVAVSKDCVMDVTRRYTNKYEEVRNRRNEADESQLQFGLRCLNEEVVSRLSPADREIAERRYNEDLNDLYNFQVRKEDDKVLPGRQTGSESWIRSRGEDGSEGKKE